MLNLLMVKINKFKNILMQEKNLITMLDMEPEKISVVKKEQIIISN